jgi:predicted Zn-dependent protease
MKRIFPRAFSIALFSLLAALAGGCASDKAIISQAQTFHSGLQPAVVQDPELAGYLQQVGDRIIATAHELNQQGYGPAGNKKEDSSWMFSKDMKFHFVNSETLNAFTTGGDHMYIYTQLFEECKTEDELAAVMAHEYGHVYGRHVHNGMNRQYMVMGGVVGASLLGQTVGGKEKGQAYAASAGGLAALAGQAIGMRFTRGDESEADLLGFDFYTHAGWDPNHFGDFFQHMIDKGLDKGPEFLSDHPSLSSRVKAARERASKLPPQANEWRRPPVADAGRFERLQIRAREVGEKMPSDKSLENSKALLAAMPRSCLTPAIQPDQRAAQQRLIAAAEAEKQRKAR